MANNTSPPTDNHHIFLSYDENIPEETFNNLISTINSSGIKFVKESRAHGPFAGVELFLPTAIVFFIGKAYFDSFFKEMGKDHYHIVKNALILFYKKVSELKYTIIASSPNKISNSGYSQVFSIYANTTSGNTVKFLIQNHLSRELLERTIESHLDLLKEHHLKGNESDLSAQILKQGKISHTILVRYNDQTDHSEIFDPMEEIRKSKLENKLT